MSPDNALHEAVMATQCMLRWRGLDWVPADQDWWTDSALMPILPASKQDNVMLLVSSERMLMVVTDAPRIGMPQLKGAMEALDGRGVHLLQLVSSHGLTTQQQNLHMFRDRFRMIAWNLVLMYPLDHHLVPRHRRATPSDLKLLPPGALKRRNILPSIRFDDAIVQYLGLSVNDIVRIDRLDGAVYFRVVIPTH